MKIGFGRLIWSNIRPPGTSGYFQFDIWLGYLRRMAETLATAGSNARPAIRTLLVPENTGIGLPSSARVIGGCRWPGISVNDWLLCVLHAYMHVCMGALPDQHEHV